MYRCIIDGNIHIYSTSTIISRPRANVVALIRGLKFYKYYFTYSLLSYVLCMHHSLFVLYFSYQVYKSFLKRYVSLKYNKRKIHKKRNK